MTVSSATTVNTVGLPGTGGVETKAAAEGGAVLRTGDPQFWAHAPLAGETLIDTDGARMKDTLRELKGAAEGARVELGFVPSPASLRAVAYLGVDTSPRDAFEVFIGRRKSDGGWFAVRGDLHGVAADASGCDVAIHNHVHVALAGSSVYSPYPSPPDLMSSAGKEGRFMVISTDGVIEWSSDIPFANQPERKLSADASDAELDEWYGQLNSGFKRKIILNVMFPTGYPSLLKGIGVRAERTPWRKVTQDLISG